VTARGVSVVLAPTSAALRSLRGQLALPHLLAVTALVLLVLAGGRVGSRLLAGSDGVAGPLAPSLSHAPPTGRDAQTGGLSRLGVGVEPSAGPAETPPIAREDRSTPVKADDPEGLTAMAAELAQRREMLTERERSLALREATVVAVEARLRAQLAQLEALKSDVARLMDELSRTDQARIKQLARVYEGMKAQKAAAILEQMGLDLLLPIVEDMRETKASAIIAEMPPEKARAVTAELARKRPLPELR
jgi:flagellar motility protein MotE (MotC chaperone)